VRIRCVDWVCGLGVRFRCVDWVCGLGVRIGVRELCVRRCRFDWLAPSPLSARDPVE
jgi:hypothetical protein